MVIRGRSRKTDLSEILTLVEHQIEEGTGLTGEVVWPSQSDKVQHKPSSIFVVISTTDDFEIVQASSAGVLDLMELTKGRVIVTLWCALATDEVDRDEHLLKDKAFGLLPNWQRIWRSLSNPMFDPTDEDGEFIFAEPMRALHFQVLSRKEHAGWGRIRGWFDILWDQDLSHDDEATADPVTKKPETSRVVPWTFELVADGDSIATVPEWSATPTGLTIATPSIVVPATVTARISGGTKGVAYLMKCRVTTTGGDTLEEERTMVVY